MSSKILRGDVFAMLPTIARGSVDCCVYSPPYWALRSYLPAGHPLKHLELGSEPTVGKFIDNQVRVASLVRECLADHAVCFINIGDTYGKDGQLCLIPWRLAISLQDDGWTVRSVVVWEKPAPMPASLSGWRWIRCRVKTKSQPRRAAGSSQTAVQYDRDQSGGVVNAARAEFKDCPGCKKCEDNGGYVLRRGSWRPTSSWEPILMLAKTDSYFCDGDAVKTPPAASTVGRDKYSRVIDDPDEQFAVRHDHETQCTSGANLRDVWRVASENLKEAHYAAWPSELVFRMLSAGVSSRGYCGSCGKPWCRVVEHPKEYQDKKEQMRNESDRWDSDRRKRSESIGNAFGGGPHGITEQVKTLGWKPSCRCIGAEEMPPRPGLVLDPFCGSGRTAVQCQRMGLDFVGCELNDDYSDMAERILRESSPLFSGQQ